MFDDIIGNKDIKEVLKVAIQASRERNQPLPHILLAGQSGCAKTTTARAIAKSLNANFIEVSPKGLSKPADLYKLVRQLSRDGYDSKGNVINKVQHPLIFLDEIHHAKPQIQEALGLVMENFAISYESNGFYYTERVPHFTLIVATTVPAKLLKSFRDRFQLTLTFSSYSLEDSIEIARLHAWRAGYSLEADAAEEIGKRSRGIGRVIVNNVRNVLDLTVAKFNSIKQVTKEIVIESFRLLDIDELGLSSTDRKFLRCLFENNTKPVGLQTLAAVMDEDSETITSAIEPYLLTQNLILRTSKGRTLTDRGARYLRSVVSEVLPSEEKSIEPWIIQKRRVG